MTKMRSVDLRLQVVYYSVLLMLGFVLFRLFFLGVWQHDSYLRLAQQQHELEKKLAPQRGSIFIQGKNGIFHPLAVDRYYQKVFLVPREVKDKQKLAEKLSDILALSREDILRKLKDENDPYEPLKSKLDDEVAEKIKALGLEGVHLEAENWRWYPQGSLASHVLGFVGMAGSQKLGRYGLEEYYEKQLVGQAGFLKSKRDALGRWLLLGDYDIKPAQNGLQLYLTLDQNVQYIVEQKLKAVMEKWQSESGCAIVTEPKTGAIRALVSLPSFNPNEYNKVEQIDIFLNSCTQKIYEPGSIFKPMTMSAALDTGKVLPDTTYLDTGLLEIGGYTISNAQDKVYGQSTMTQVLEKSINTGAVFVQKQIGGEVFKKYIEAFGFSRPTGVDLAGEISGSLTNLKEGKEVALATASFGQGIAVTPLQIAAAIGVVANEGKLMRPYLVEKMVSEAGEEVFQPPQALGQIISPQTADKLTAMLVSTVRNGYDKIKINNYFIAGKTGTAQIPNPDKRGYSDQTSHSFVGYAPAYNPRFLIFLKIEKPQGIRFASESLSPAFAELMQYLLNYYEIPPDE